MEKSFIVYHLALPQEMIDHICSFVFYTIEESRKRNREMYSTVVYEYKHIRREQMISFRPNIVSFYYILPIHNQLIVSVICYTCGNYVKPTHHYKKIVCQCRI